MDREMNMEDKSEQACDENAKNNVLKHQGLCHNGKKALWFSLVFFLLVKAILSHICSLLMGSIEKCKVKLTHNLIRT